jgi:hypothetical protein
MLNPALATVTFYAPFSITIEVLIETTGVDPITGDPTTSTSISTEIPTVTADFVDPGVVVTVGTGTVTLSGAYNSIIPITWHWLDNNNQALSGPTPPAVTTYSKIVRVDSPGFLSKDCNYTIAASGSSDVFVHTVTLRSWTVIADELTALLKDTL